MFAIERQVFVLICLPIFGLDNWNNDVISNCKLSCTYKLKPQDCFLISLTTEGVGMDRMILNLLFYTSLTKGCIDACATILVLFWIYCSIYYKFPSLPPSLPPPWLLVDLSWHSARFRAFKNVLILVDLWTGCILLSEECQKILRGQESSMNVLDKLSVSRISFGCPGSELGVLDESWVS